MENKLYYELLKTLETMPRSNKLNGSIGVLKHIIKNRSYDLKKVGSSGIVIFASNQELIPLVSELIDDINTDKLNTHFNKLADAGLIFRLYRSKQIKNDKGDNEKRGFKTAIFVLPTYKKFNPELYNSLEKGKTPFDLNIIIQRLLWVTTTGLKSELRNSITVRRNDREKKYRNIMNKNIFKLWSLINNNKKLIPNKSYLNKKVKIKQLENIKKEKEHQFINH